VPSPSGPADLLADLSRVLERLGLAWYVFGAQAALIWGRPRLTTDVDVTVRLGSHDPTMLVEALEAAGFRLRIVATPQFLRQTRVLPLAHEPTAMAVDIVLAGPGLEDLFLSRAVMVKVGASTIPIISAEDLIVTKVLAGRPKDIDDIGGVLAERGHALDLDLIRATISLLEAALGQSDLLPIFETALAGSRRT
jgi:hypothetical protein